MPTTVGTRTERHAEFWWNDPGVSPPWLSDERDRLQPFDAGFGWELPKIHEPRIAQAYYVDAVNGNDSTGNGTSGTPWKTLDGAIVNLRTASAGALASWATINGDIALYLKAGTYQGTAGAQQTTEIYFDNAARRPAFNRWLIVMPAPGVARADVIVRPPTGATGAKYAIKTYHDGTTYFGQYVQIRGLTIDGTSTRLGATDCVGIYVNQTPNFEVVLNEIKGFQAADTAGVSSKAQGVYAEATSYNLKVYHNLIHDIGTTTGTINEQEHGVYFGGHGVAVVGNVVYNIPNGFGIQVYNGGSAVNDYTIASNTVYGTIEKSCLLVPGNSKNGRIVNNILKGATQYGIEFLPATFTGSGNSCRNNVFHGNTVGTRSHTGERNGWTFRFEITTDPLLTNPPTDFSPGSSGSAANAALHGFTPDTDINGATRSGSFADIGAVAKVALTAVGKSLGLVWNTRATVGKSNVLRWNTRTALGKSVQAVWHTRTSAGKSVQAVWNVRSAPGKSLGLVWNTRANVGKAVALVWHTRLTVGKSVGLVWHTRVAPGKAVAFVWNTRANVGKSVQLIWNVAFGVTVGKSVALVWHTRLTVGKSVGLVWHTRVARGKTVSFVWNTRASVGKSLGLVWHTRANVGKAVSFVWHTRTRVGKSADVRWAVRVASGKAVAFVWHTRSAPGKSIALVWHTRIRVGKAVDTRWAVRTALGKAVALQWNTRAPVGKSVQLIWNTQSGSTVGKSLGLVWNTRALAGKSVALVWHTRIRTGKTVSFIWHTRTTSGKTVVLAWGALVLASKTVALRWNTRAFATKTVALRWNTRTLATKTVDVRWAVRTSATKSVALAWGTRAKVGKAVSFVWHTRAHAGRSLGLVWHARSLAFAPLVLRWGVTVPAGRPVSLLWAVTAAVGAPVTLSWETRVPVGAPLTLLWFVSSQVSPNAFPFAPGGVYVKDLRGAPEDPRERADDSGLTGTPSLASFVADL